MADRRIYCTNNGYEIWKIQYQFDACYMVSRANVLYAYFGTQAEAEELLIELDLGHYGPTN